MKSMDVKRFFKVNEEIRIAGQQREIARKHYEANEFLLKEMRQLVEEYQDIINFIEEKELSLDDLKEKLDDEFDDTTDCV